MSQRTNFTLGLVLAAVGVMVLGADRIIASADTNAPYFQSLTWYTVVGLAIILAAVFVISRVKK